MKVCPSCYSEFVSRNGIGVCPRHEIGECRYDAYELHSQTLDLRTAEFREQKEGQPPTEVI